MMYSSFAARNGEASKGGSAGNKSSISCFYTPPFEAGIFFTGGYFDLETFAKHSLSQSSPPGCLVSLPVAPNHVSDLRVQEAVGQRHSETLVWMGEKILKACCCGKLGYLFYLYG